MGAKPDYAFNLVHLETLLKSVTNIIGKYESYVILKNVAKVYYKGIVIIKSSLFELFCLAQRDISNNPNY